MSTGSRENKQNKVRTQLWDTLYVGYVAPLLTFVPANLLIQDKIWIFNILYYSYSGLVTPGLTDTALSLDYALLETPISYPLNS